MITSNGESDSREDAGLLPETRRALGHGLAVAQAEGRVPSAVAAVVRDGRTVWTGKRGGAVAAGGEEPEGGEPTPHTQYRIGSLTKTFVAVQVMRLRDAGLLDLADPLGRYLEVPAEAGEEPASATIAQLLSHSGGLAAEPRGPWWERTPGELRSEPADLFGERPVRHPAGRRHHYSNLGYALLGALVERLRGAPWSDVLREEVLRPLGMDRTTPLPEEPYARGWAVHPWADAVLPEPLCDTGRMAPAGQLWSTAADLCRFAAFLTAGDDRVLGAESLAEMRTPAVAPEASGWDQSYGLGMQLVRSGGRLLAGHTGSMPGFLAAVWTAPEERLASVVLANATAGLPVGGLAAELLDTVAEREPSLPPPWRPRSAADPELLALTGPWYWGPSGFALRLREGRALELVPLGGRGRASRFRPEADGTWTGLDGYYAGETLRVARDADGGVSHLDLGTFVFTRHPYDPQAPVPGGVDPEGWRAD
ncbi:serine hydrolase [Streptomyces sp. TRM43335]|uniref:Serine hydrolase n=1 Tax=Streptomyces taklimakanensis TaxID=2569853 RepID=A0A6G2BD75_9ACTN|nr:serine hydrolase domain-containing protein [Streptomyces taklimakanensis]MTE20029.1 serine hydrolase [Streptomyces taklimakanensis]